MIANNIIVPTLISICFLASCKSPVEQGIFYSDSEKILLMVNDRDWKFLFPYGICSEHTRLGENIRRGKILQGFQPRTTVFPNDTSIFFFNGDNLEVDNHKFKRLAPLKYDSLIVLNRHRDDILDRVSLDIKENLNWELLAHLIKLEDMPLLDAGFTPDNYTTEYILWNTGEIVSRKISSKSVSCIKLNE